MSTRKIIEINEDLCTGCGDCVPNCAEGAIQIKDGKAKLVEDLYCDGLGACLGHCPEGALTIIEREADEFNEEAVKKLLASQGREFVPQGHATPESNDPPACPSSKLRLLNQTIYETPTGDGASKLSNWPLQMRLVPPSAPHMKNAHILIASDCTAFACPDFQSTYLPGKALLIGCPKLDNAQEYVEKLAETFKVSEPKSISVLIMEVPCCQGMRMIVEKAAELSGTQVPVETTVLGIKGAVLQRA